MGQLVANLNKFAVDLVVKDSRKFVTGAKKVYQMVQEGLKELPVSISSNTETKQDDIKRTENTEAKMEEKNENNMKQQGKTLSRLVEGSKKKKNEGVKTPILVQNKKERIFIRSRL